MKTIVLTKENTVLLPLGNYLWTPPSTDEAYNLVLKGISIITDGGYINTGGGYIYTGGGDITTDGGAIITDGGDIYTGDGDINTGGGYIYTGGGDITTDGGYINTGGGYINTGGGYINTGGGHIICDKLYWRCMQMPNVQSGKIEANCVYPEVVTRPHWKSRLADIVVIPEGCYTDIFAAVEPHMCEILASDRWSECERWILESIANYIRKV